VTALRDNRAQLIQVTARAYVAPVRLSAEIQPGRDGRTRLLPGNGGVSIGLHTGDVVPDADLGDHVMPGAALEADPSDAAVVGDVHLLSCIGNVVVDRRGSVAGVVVGKRGGLAPGFWAPTHLGIELTDVAMASLMPGDALAVQTVGRGLELTDWPDVDLYNCSPQFLDLLDLRVVGDYLEIAVRAVIASPCAGAGLGQDPWIGDLEVTVADALPSDLRFGDLVAFLDIDAGASRSYRPGQVSIGVVAHGPSLRAGHGVGVTIVLGAGDSRLRPVEDVTANGLGGTLRAMADTLGRRQSGAREEQEKQ